MSKSYTCLWLKLEDEEREEKCLAGAGSDRGLEGQGRHRVLPKRLLSGNLDFRMSEDGTNGSLLKNSGRLPIARPGMCCGRQSLEDEQIQYGVRRRVASAEAFAVVGQGCTGSFSLLHEKKHVSVHQHVVLALHSLLACMTS